VKFQVAFGRRMHRARRPVHFCLEGIATALTLRGMAVVHRTLVRLSVLVQVGFKPWRPVRLRAVYRPVHHHLLGGVQLTAGRGTGVRQRPHWRMSFIAVVHRNMETGSILGRQSDPVEHVLKVTPGIISPTTIWGSARRQRRIGEALEHFQRQHASGRLCGCGKESETLAIGAGEDQTLLRLLAIARKKKPNDPQLNCSLGIFTRKTGPWRQLSLVPTGTFESTRLSSGVARIGGRLCHERRL